ncbi:MAG: hypothetical protein IJS00_00150 [Paludibacteraceae bacterium]|nr:hypothetical protein [Paludibacteraceae bacterium]
MKRIFNLILVFCLSLSMYAVKQVVWSGSQSISYNQEYYSGVTLFIYNLQEVAEGDVIEVQVSAGMESPTYDMQRQAGGEWSWTSLNPTVNNGIMSYTVENATIAKELATRGLIITGQGYDISSVTLVKNGSSEVWRTAGYDVSANFDTYETTYLSTLRPGYTVKVFTLGGSPKMQYKVGGGWSWTDIEGVTTANGVMRYTVASPQMDELLRTRGLVVCNSGTINRIAIETSQDIPLWVGSQEMTWNEISNYEQYLTSAYSSWLEAGDKIIITISGTTGDDRQVVLRDGSSQNLQSTTLDNEGAQTVSFTLTADDITALADGIKLSGTGYTATQITLHKSSTQLTERTVWQSAGTPISWNQEYYTGGDMYTVENNIDMSGLAIGDKVRVFVKAGIDSPTYSLRSKSNDDSWNEIDDAYSSIVTTAAPTAAGEYGYIDINLTTAAEVSQMVNRGILFRGQGYDVVAIHKQVNASLSVSDTSDPTATLESLSGLNAAVDFTINRTLYRDGYYNTLCLPFDMSSEQIASSALTGGSVYRFSNAVVASDGAGGYTLELQVTAVNDIEAGVPYLIKFAPAATDLTSITFEDVVIRTSTASSIDGGGVTCYGMFAPTHLDVGTGVNAYLFLGAENTLYWPATTDTESDKLSGFRAYFQVNTVVDGGSSSPIRRGMPARIVESSQTPTSLTTDMLNETNSSRKVIENGQVVIIRNGVRYSLIGTRLD